MKMEKSNIILLFRRLLDVTEKEQEVIKNNNIDELEHCSLLKKNLVNEIKMLKKDRALIAQDEERAEIESILNKIDIINSANYADARKMQDTVKGKMRDQSNRKTAIKAYNKLV